MPGSVVSAPDRGTNLRASRPGSIAQTHSGGLRDRLLCARQYSDSDAGIGSRLGRPGDIRQVSKDLQGQKTISKSTYI